MHSRTPGKIHRVNSSEALLADQWRSTCFVHARKQAPSACSSKGNIDCLVQIGFSVRDANTLNVSIWVNSAELSGSLGQITLGWEEQTRHPMTIFDGRHHVEVTHSLLLCTSNRKICLDWNLHVENRSVGHKKNFSKHMFNDQVAKLKRLHCIWHVTIEMDGKKHGYLRTKWKCTVCEIVHRLPGPVCRLMNFRGGR